MICPKCHTPLDMPVNTCPQCGAALHRSGGRILIVAAALVLLIVFGVYGYIQYRFFGSHDEVRETIASSPGESADTRRPAGSPNPSAESGPSSPALNPVNIGELYLKDIAGGQLGTYPVAIVSSGWFAFPSHLLIGAYRCQVALDSGPSLPVEGAILQDGDNVGLWEVPANAAINGLALAPWDPQVPLQWLSLEERGAIRTVQVSSTEPLGNFDRITLARETSAPGVFIQNGKVVGWSFGDRVPGGFLWVGRRGSELIPEFYIDDFYRLTFEGSREEAFVLALADPDLSDMQQLTALVEAHLLQPRMPPDLVPQRIAPTRIHDMIRGLVDNLRTRNRTDELLTLFDAQILSVINDPLLVADLVEAARRTGEYIYALDILESQEALSSDIPASENFDTIQAAVYREWLDRLLAEGDIDAVRSVYNEAVERFPNDPGVRLTGVELLLLSGNWDLAERLLTSRGYPPDLRDRVDRLEREIADLKSQEGKIVIRFRPGSRNVPVSVILDGILTQPFLIDTGATVVTVPSETVRRLGIDLSGSLPRRLFYSATGARNAVEVTLPSVEIDGWTVTDVKALVVDLPGQPGVGLLGMNYLRNFRMDLDTDQGLLTLAPR